MIGLKGARVIVVDDNEEEALPILRAFAKKGIPTAFFDGNLIGFPSKGHRLSGVRLAILDMNLVLGHTSNKEKAAALVNVLGQILSPQNGPYAILAWTMHPEVLEDFKKYLFAAQSVPNPIFIVVLEKRDCKNKKGGVDLTVLSDKVEEVLSQFSPLLLLQAWEEKCFWAAAEVTNTLGSLVAGDADNLEEWLNLWKSQLLQLMYAMAEAEAEKHLDINSCLAALFGVLNPLHADRMESNIIELSDLFVDNSDEILAASMWCRAEG
jgi:hypothetical protein